MSWSIDAILNDKYRLIRLLGDGSAGTVWEAENTLVGRRVAVKILHSHLATHEEIRSRFVAEARASARIASPHVVDVFDLGEAQNGTPFMVMELCEGETLDHITEQRGALGASYACEIMLQICVALEAAHELGIVHRDLKPANVMVLHPEPDRFHAKVLDFGIAKGVHPDGEEWEERDVFGTPHYIAPEQAAGDAIDHRADVYAAGAILYELLSGRPPFDGPMTSVVLADVLTQPPEPLSSFVQNLPLGLSELVHRTLRKNPDERPQTATQLKNALLRYSAEAPPISSRRELASDRKSAEAIPLVSKRSPKLQLARQSSVPPPPTRPPPLPRRRGRGR